MGKKQPPATPAKVRAEVTRVERRVAAQEATIRRVVAVQVDSLTKAERLRRLVLAVIGSSKLGSPAAPGTTVSTAKYKAMAAFAVGLLPFHDPKAGKPPKLPDPTHEAYGEALNLVTRAADGRGKDAVDALQAAFDAIAERFRATGGRPPKAMRKRAKA